MQIHLNGSVKALAVPCTIVQLVQMMGIKEQRYAVEVNETIVPRSQHENFTLSENDRVEIVQAIGGG